MGSKGEGRVSWSAMAYVGLILETKVLKQLVRDIIQPEKDLGHSDRKEHKSMDRAESTMTTKGKMGVENGTETVDITERMVEKGSETGGWAGQFREAAEQACEDCQ